MASAVVGDASKGGTGRGSPIRRKDRFPHNNYVQLVAGVRLQDVFDCGGPPQPSGSSGGKQQDKPRSIGFFVEGFFELLKICWREC